MSNKKNNEKVAVVNMAWGTGSETKESVFKLYIGIAPFTVLGVNSPVEQLKEWFPTRDYAQNPPNYAYNKEGDAKGTFVTFFIKTAVDHKEANGIDLTTRCAYLLKKEMNMNKDKTKVQVINSYGDTGWLTAEQFKEKTLPDYMVKNGFITEGMRPAYVGEEDLVKFLKTYINIPNPRSYDQKTQVWTTKTGKDLEAALCGFSQAELDKIIDGNVSPIMDALKYQPNNKIKLLAGVRTTADNKEFQDICSRLPIHFGSRNYVKLDKDLNAIKDAGGYSSTYFGEMPYTFQEYKPTPTSFENPLGPGPELENDPFKNFG